jgi:addiction module RelE/StbE family toxin
MKVKIVYTPTFVRQYDKLIAPLKEEVRDRIGLFQKDQRHPSLRTHKLKGRLAGKWSFRVNYSYRVVFCYDAKDTVALLDVGDHSVYE